MDGLVNSDLEIYSGRFFGEYSGTIGVGGRVDSYYEYLLKQWIQIGKPEHHP